MKHIAFAVIAAAVLAVVGPRITPDNWNLGAQSAAAAAPSGSIGHEHHPTSLLRMRAGEEYPSSFDRR